MSICAHNHFTIYEDVPIARVNIGADLSQDAWFELMNSLFSDSRYRKGLGIMVDRRLAPLPQKKDLHAITRFVDQKEATGETCGWALVVADLGSYGMGRIAQQLSESEKSLGVFWDIPEALAWLAARSQESSHLRPIES